MIMAMIIIASIVLYGIAIGAMFAVYKYNNRRKHYTDQWSDSDLALWAVVWPLSLAFIIPIRLAELTHDYVANRLAARNIPTAKVVSK